MSGRTPLAELGKVERENKEALRRHYPILDQYLAWKGMHPMGDVDTFLGERKARSR